MSQYYGYTRIFTNGSQIGDAVGVAAIVGSRVSSTNGSSIFSAEARRILLALDMVHQPIDRQFLFLSDSLSCLQCLENLDLSHPLIADILCRVHILLSHGTKVAFMWVPATSEWRATQRQISLQKQLYSYRYQIYLFLIQTTVLSYVPTHWNNGKKVGILKPWTSYTLLSQKWMF